VTPQSLRDDHRVRDDAEMPRRTGHAGGVSIATQLTVSTAVAKQNALRRGDYRRVDAMTRPALVAQRATRVPG